MANAVRCRDESESSLHLIWTSEPQPQFQSPKSHNRIQQREHPIELHEAIFHRARNRRPKQTCSVQLTLGEREPQAALTASGLVFDGIQHALHCLIRNSLVCRLRETLIYL